MNSLRLITVFAASILLFSPAQAQMVAYVNMQDAPADVILPEATPVEDNSRKAERAEAMAYESNIEEAVPINLLGVCKHIQYPRYAIQNQIEGIVQLRVFVNEKGRYVKHIVLRSPHQVLTEAVEAELHRLSFLPTLRHDMSASGWTTVPFTFELKQTR